MPPVEFKVSENYFILNSLVISLVRSFHPERSTSGLQRIEHVLTFIRFGRVDYDPVTHQNLGIIEVINVLKFARVSKSWVGTQQENEGDSRSEIVACRQSIEETRADQFSARV